MEQNLMKNEIEAKRASRFGLGESSKGDTCIKVIGVGGGGCNAINHMINSNVQGVEFIAANTDAQSLRDSLASLKISLGETMLGSGAKPEAGKLSAEESREKIKEAIEGAHMLFIAAGMGGGTGTGAAPVVAEIAQEIGILTVGVVTRPFFYEGTRRARSAEAGINELTKHVDSLIVVLNDKLEEILGDEATLEACFHASDDVLKNAVGGIAEIINFPGLVNVDFEDVRTVMNDRGRALMGSAYAAGPDRATKAAVNAISSPLLEGVDLRGARGVLVNISGTRSSLKNSEVRLVMQTIYEYADADAHIIFGAVFDESLGDNLRVTVVASGLGRPEVRRERFEISAQGTGTHDALPLTSNGKPDYDRLEVPTSIRNPRSKANDNPALNIPSFLKKQAD